MKDFATTITQRGQLTIPAEIRRELGLKPHDTVMLRVENGTVTLTPRRLTIEELAGSITPRNRPEDFEAISRAAKEEHVERFMKKMRGE